MSTCSAQGQVSVFYVNHVSMVNRFSAFPKDRQCHQQQSGASGCLVFESVKNEDNIDIWGCNVTELQSFKGKNHFIYTTCNIQCFVHLSNWIKIFSSL